MLLADLAFMSSWCSAMKKLFTRYGNKVVLWRWGPEYKAVFQFCVRNPNYWMDPPAKRESQLMELREGLSLFAAIAWVDAEVLGHLLRQSVCEPEVMCLDQLSEELSPPVFIELELCGSSTLEDEAMASMCCRLGLENTSSEFQEAWTEIELLAQKSTATTAPPTLAGLDIPVRFVVANPDGTLELVGRMTRDTLDKQQIRWGWASSRSDQAVPCSKGLHDCYSSMVLDSITTSCIDTVSYATGISFIQPVNELSGSVRFSKVAFSLWLEKNGTPEFVGMCQMLSGLFCGGNISTSDRCVAALVEVQVWSSRGIEWQFEAFCAALTVSQSCRSIHILTTTYLSDYRAVQAKAWQWLAYALFSKQALSRSSIRTIKLSRVCLAAEDVQAIEDVLTARNPEQELCNWESDESLPFVPSCDQEYCLKENAVVRRYDLARKEFESTDIFRGRRVCGVKLVADDDEGSECVFALVPAVGLCTVERRSLELCDCSRGDSRTSEKGLELEMHMAFRDSWDGVSRLIELVGPSLQCVRLMFPQAYELPALATSSIIASCPRLVELTIKNRFVSAEDFVGACERYHPRLRRLQARFDDIGKVARALKDPSHALTKQLQWWFCYRYSRGLQPLQNMLDVNRTLRLLTVATFQGRIQEVEDALMRYDCQELCVGEETPTKNKLAFLSVFSFADHPSRPEKQKTCIGLQFARMEMPDSHVVATIFAFAAKRAVRKVNVVRG